MLRRPAEALARRRVLSCQAGYARRCFWRAPVAAFFTIGFPLTCLVVLSSALRNPVLVPATGLRLAQYFTPAFAVFGVTFAAFSSLAVHVASKRESGVLKRQQGTPVPAWARVGGLVASRVEVAAVATTLLVAVGVAAYQVHVVWHRLPAAVLTLLVGVLCFAALGLAVAALTPSALAAQAVTTGLLIPLSFVSGIFNYGDLPPALGAVGSFFPLRHFAHALAGDFDPTATGPGIYASDLLILVLWGLLGLAVALRVAPWRQDPRRAFRPARATAVRSEREAPVPPPRDPVVDRPVAVAATVSRPGRPGRAALIRGQVRYAFAGLVRHRGTLFWTVAFPTMLLLLAAPSSAGQTWHGLRMVQVLAPSLTVYAICLTTYVTLAQAVSRARERGVLKRLRGTPLPLGAYLAGRIGAASALAVLSATLVFAVASAQQDLRVSPSVLPAETATLLVGAASFTALGLALGMLLPDSRAVSAVGLGTLLALSFVSDVFLFPPSMPQWLSLIAGVFPLRHFSDAALGALNTTDVAGAWGSNLAWVAAWGVAGGAAAWWAFRWRAARPV